MYVCMYLSTVGTHVNTPGVFLFRENGSADSAGDVIGSFYNSDDPTHHQRHRYEWEHHWRGYKKIK